MDHDLHINSTLWTNLEKLHQVKKKNPPILVVHKMLWIFKVLKCLDLYAGYSNE